MRFRSLVVSWCVCAIHCGLQTSTAALGHQSLDETSSRRSTRYPLGDVEIPPDVLLERRRSSRSISGSVPSFLASRSSRTDDRDNTADRFVLKRRSSRRKRRKKCSRRKQDARRRMRPEKVKLVDDEVEESKSSTESSRIVKSSSAFDAVENVPTSTLNPTLELTTESSTTQDFIDTTTDVVPSTRIAAKVVRNGMTRRNSQRNSFRKKCTECATGDCKGGETKKIIDILGDEFFSPNVGKSSASQTSSSSSEDANL